MLFIPCFLWCQIPSLLCSRIPMAPNLTLRSPGTTDWYNIYAGCPRRLRYTHRSPWGTVVLPAGLPWATMAFATRLPLPTQGFTAGVATGLLLSSWQRPMPPKRPASVVIDSTTYLLTISSLDIDNISRSLAMSGKCALDLPHAVRLFYKGE